MVSDSKQQIHPATLLLGQTYRRGAGSLLGPLTARLGCTFSVLLIGPFMNIGEFAASHGKKLILGDLTSLSDRSLCPGEPSSFRDLGSDDEPVEFHSFFLLYLL